MELPPDLRYDGLPSQPTGVQRHSSSKKAKQAMGLGKAVRTKKRAYKRKPSSVQGPTVARVSFQTSMQENLNVIHHSLR